MTYIETAIVLLVAGIMLALVAGYASDAQRELVIGKMAAEMKELDEDLQGYAEAEYANLRRCAGGGSVPDNGVTREIDIPAYSLTSMRAGDQPLFFIITGTAQNRTPLNNVYADCVHDLDHNRDGDTTDQAENYPRSLEAAGFLSTWLVRHDRTTGAVDRYGDSVGGVGPGTNQTRWLARLDREARGVASLVVRPTFRFVDGDPAPGSVVPRLQIFTGLARVPSRRGSSIYNLDAIGSAALRSGSPNIGILPRHVSGNAALNTVVFGPGDSWRVDIVTASRNNNSGTLGRLRTLCSRMTLVMPWNGRTSNDVNCNTDGRHTHYQPGLVRHPAGLTEDPATPTSFDPQVASAVFLTTISDSKFLDPSLSRRYIGVPQANRMETDLDLGGFGIKNVTVLAGPDIDGDGVPDHPPVILGPPADRRSAADRVHQPIVLHGDAMITGKLFVGDGASIVDLGRPEGAYNPTNDLNYDRNVATEDCFRDGLCGQIGLREGGKFVSSVAHQTDPHPLPVTLAEIMNALPEVTNPTGGDDYGTGDLPFSGLPGVQIAGGVFNVGNTWTLGGTNSVGPRHNLVAVASYVDPATSKFQQSWNEFHTDAGHDPEDVFAGDDLAVADADWSAGNYPRDHSLARLWHVNTHRDIHRDGEVHIGSSDGTQIIGGGERGGVTVFSPKSDTRIVAGSQVFLPYDAVAASTNTALTVATATAGGSEIWANARQSSSVGNIVLHNPSRTESTRNSAGTGSPFYPDGGVVVLDPDQVFLTEEDGVLARRRASNEAERFLVQDAETRGDNRANLQFLDDRDDPADPETAREVFPGSGVYDETRVAFIGSRVDDITLSGSNYVVNTGSLAGTLDAGPVAERVEGRPLSRAIPRLSPAYVDHSGDTNIGASGVSDANRGQLAYTTVSSLGTLASVDHPFIASGLQETAVPSDVGDIPCADGSVAIRTAIPTSWVQPQYVSNSSDQVLSWNISIGGASVAQPEYAGSSGVNLNYSTILPWRGWAVNPSTGVDAATYGGVTDHADAPITPADTTRTFLYYCVS